MEFHMKITKKVALGACALVALGVGATGATAQADEPNPTCTTTPMGLAKQVGGPVDGDLDATGCDIGVYNPTAVTDDAVIHGAKHYGVVVDGSKGVDITDATVSDIGDDPFSGTQYGVGIYYTGGATGTIRGTSVSQYQKGGIVAKGEGTKVAMTDNTVTGLGAVKFIAQNGIQVSNKAAATVTGNTVSKNIYNGGGWTSTGIMFYGADAASTPKAGKIASTNDVFQNQANITVVK
jgi:hypothetical protein